jgi:ketosteroid isomerase-like protein
MLPMSSTNRDNIAAMGARLEHVRSYYEALNTGDAEAVARHFTEDAVHYYTRRDPHVGARAIAENAALAVQRGFDHAARGHTALP